MPTPLFIYGAGGLARETLFWVRRAGGLAGRYEWRGFVTTALDPGNPRESHDQVVGDEPWLAAQPRPFAVVIGIGTPSARQAIATRLERLDGVEFPSVVDPTVVLDDSCQVGRGVVITPGNILTVNVDIGDFTFLNLACTFGHEARVGAWSVVNPSCNISGGVRIGAGCLIGTGAKILEYRQIGDGATVGGGAVVTRDVEPGTVVAGVPARPLASA